MERALILIPTYNERENLPSIISAVESVFDCDFLVIDDNSPDGTGRLADELAASALGSARVIRQKNDCRGR